MLIRETVLRKAVAAGDATLTAIKSLYYDGSHPVHCALADTVNGPVPLLQVAFKEIIRTALVGLPDDLMGSITGEHVDAVIDRVLLAGDETTIDVFHRLGIQAQSACGCWCACTPGKVR